jgi:two-component system, OmpR family, phosphate regulon sensor histidine kinase PhoR
MNELESVFLEKIETPVLVILEENVRFANSAAKALLGDHCLHQNFRLAIRHPSAVELLTGLDNGTRLISGFRAQGDAWQLSCTIMPDGQRLIRFIDVSARDSVSRAHTDFVANASHELRTPLAAILGYIETLLDPGLKDDDVTRTRFLKTMEREAHRMQTLVDDLMSLSRIEAGKYDLPSTEVNIILIAKEVAGEFKDYRDIRLVLDEGPLLVRGDASQLKQALRNLVENAHKYGKPQGEIILTAQASAERGTLVKVKDDGQGIAAEHIPRLTERFYRVDSGRSRGLGGTGLGLAIVKHIVDRHRGRLTIESRLAEGTEVSLHFPMLPDVHSADLSAN